MRLHVMIRLALGCLILVGIVYGGNWDTDLQEIQDAIRSKGASWTADSNPIWEMSKEERQELCGLILEDRDDQNQELETVPELDEVDEVLDWRNYNGYNYVTGIRNQGSCGSCWAFGGLAAMEARTLIMADMPEYPLNLSEQMLVSCSEGSCNGYSLSGTCNYLVNSGTVDEACFPYTANDQIPCNARCEDWQQRNRRAANWNWVGSTELAIKNELLEGPVYAGFIVYEDFNAYSSGVYEHVWGDQTGAHAISIVGWDDDADCWICKNSWGSTWGEDGYFRIRKGENECGIEEWIATLTPLQTNFSILTMVDFSVSEEVGDGDGVLNPGETAHLVFSIANGPLCQEALNVQAVLSTSDSRVEILDNQGSFGNIGGGEIIQNNADLLTIRIQDDVALSVIDFTLNLSASGGYSVDQEFSIELSINQVGFPIEVVFGVTASPIAYDIDGDNSKEIIVGAYDGKLYAWDNTGALKPGFPYQTGNRIDSSPALGDLNGDGTTDIAFASLDHHLYFLDAFGNELSTPIDLGMFISATPALGQLDDEPGLEAVVAGYDGRIWAVKGDGTVLNGFPVQLTAENVISTGAVLVDLAGDSHPELVFGTWDGMVIALNTDGSTLWEASVGGGVKADMTAANLTGEGTRILVGNTNGHLVILDNEGSEVNRFDLGSAIKSSPVPDNFDLDEDLEIAVITVNGQLFLLNPDGTYLPHFPVSVGCGVVSSPAISDIDNQNGPDIVFGDMNNRLHAYSLSGNELPYFPINVSCSVFSSPAITNLDDDGDLEVMVGTGNRFVVIDYKTDAWQNQFWNMFRGNPQRTANYTDGFYFGVEPELVTKKPVPLDFYLAPNYPNPFNPSTTLTYTISQPAFVSLTIWNVLGQRVATLIDGYCDSGTHRVLFDASAKSSGVYFARFQAESHIQIQKMLLVR